MNSLPSVSRMCARHVLALRPATSPCTSITPSTTRTLSTQYQARNLSTTLSSSDAHASDVSTITPSSPPPSQPSISTDTAQIFSTFIPDEVQQQQQKLRGGLQESRLKLLTARVSRAGTMKNCIQITYQKQTFDSFLQKHYTRPARLLVHDPHPAGYLRVGDIIEYSSWTAAEKSQRNIRKSTVEEEILAKYIEQGKKPPRKFVPQSKIYKRSGKKRTGNHGTGEDKWVGPRYVVRKVVTPFGTPLDSRMEELTRKVAEGKEAELEGAQVGLKGRGGTVRKNVGSAKVAG